MKVKSIDSETTNAANLTTKQSTTQPKKTKTTPHKKRMIRYYTSQKAIQQGYKTCSLKSLNGQYLDDLVRSQIGAYLSQGAQPDNSSGNEVCSEPKNTLTHEPIVQYLESLPAPEQDYQLRQLIEQVTISTTRVVIDLQQTHIEALSKQAALVLSDAAADNDLNQGTNKNDENSVITALPQARYQATVIEADAANADTNSQNNRPNIIRLVLDIQIKRQGQSRMILTPDGKDLVMPKRSNIDEGLVAALCKGQYWQQKMQTERWSFEELAKHENTDVKNAHGWISLTYLAPAIIKRILQGKHLPSWTLKRLIQAAKLPLWDAQYRFLGIEDQLSTEQTQ